MTERADQYAIEQSRLRNEQGVAPPQGDDLHIEPPKIEAPTVNPAVFRDVEGILFRGFIHVAATINDVHFVFKSLNHHEFEWLAMFSASRSDYKAVQAFYNRFLAFGVLMVDGVNLLPDRASHIDELIEFFSDLNEQGRQKVIYELSAINRRASQAVILTEAFAYEPLSRLRWAQVHGLDLTSTAITGVEGTTQLGLNWGQLAWRALNYFEDSKDVAEREWENAKFVASSMAGKGMSKVYSQDKQRRKDEQEERLARRDQILRLALLGEGAKNEKSNPNMQVARTVEELTTQLERDLKGEKDWHDEVVDAHEQRVQQQRLAHTERIQAMRQEYSTKFGDAPILGQTAMNGLSQAAVREQIERKRQLMAQRFASRQVLPEFVDPKMSDFMEKWHGPVDGAAKFRGLSIPKDDEER